MYFEELFPALVGNIPELLLWSTGAVIGIILISRNKDRAVKFFLTGCIFLLAAELSQPFLHALVITQFGPDSGISVSQLGTMMTFANGLPVGLVSLTGFVFLTLAFWRRFRIKRVEDPAQ